MKDENKTKKQLLSELIALRQQIAELQQPENQQEQATELLRQSEARYRAVVEDQTELICRFLPEGILTFVNEAYCRYFNRTREDLIGHSFMQLIPASDWQKVKTHFDSLGPENPLSTHEHRVIGQDGEIRWQQWTNRVILAEQGLIQEFQSVGRDITERKRAEEAMSKAHDDLERRVQERTQELLEANKKLEQEIENRKHVENTLRDSETYMKSILEAAPVGIGLVHNRVFVWISDRMCEMLGYSEGELVGQSARIGYVSDEEFERVGKVKYSAIKERGFGTAETRLKRKDGSIIDALLCSSLIDPADPSKGVIFTALDITERKEAKEELRESEQRYRSLFKNNHSVMLFIDPVSADIIDANPAACSFYGWSHEELTSMKITDINMLSNEQVFQEMERAKSEERNHFFFRHRLANEQIRDVETYSGPIRLHGKKLLYSITHDISERKLVEEALRESEERHRLLLEASPDPIVVYDMEGRATYVNPAFVETFGWSSEELLGKRIDFVPEDNWPETRAVIARMVRGERIQSFETRRLTKAGRILDIQLSSSVFHDRDATNAGNIVILRDVTDRRRAEDALRKREAELAAQQRHLEEVNAALKVLLKRREEDKGELEERVLTNVKKLMLPYVEKLKNSRLDSDQMTLVGILEANIKEIVSPFITKLSSRFLSLTPAEIQVVSLVKEGKDTKTMAQLLNLSPRTVESHRQNIRKKLGLKNKKANLRTHLLSIQ